MFSVLLVFTYIQVQDSGGLAAAAGHKGGFSLFSFHHVSVIGKRVRAGSAGLPYMHGGLSLGLRERGGGV